MNRHVELGLGTVQFGLDYGISNTLGQPSEKMVSTILDRAATHGIKVLDTASAYGESETVLGRTVGESGRFRIVTKLPKIDSDSIGGTEIDMLERAFDSSFVKLGGQRLAGLLVHNPDDLLKPGADRLYRLMESFVSNGLVEKTGVSIAGISRGKEEEVGLLLPRYDFGIVQLPQNVFDQSLALDGVIERLRNDGVEVHVRSVFLQGLLLMDADALDPYFAPVRPLITDWRDFLGRHGLSAPEAALAFVRVHVRPDVILAGVADEKQLEELVRAFSSTTLPDEDFSRFALDDPAFTNPFFWKTGR